jgi:hypothetical protein
VGTEQVSQPNSLSLVAVHSRYDHADGRGIYRVVDVPLREVDVNATRWRMQLSARYTF